ncbi:conserved hypothetical protein [Paenibacillus curdlanolyticus YK9]|uniref:Ferric siderophore reductase C-terminal domain-containing protein n=1 Tax=Paenibacillus curdlanolyticus YK9 TaxID=717606 RepID=E0IAJ1_9BACL|nr:(2Fe-2S)-binding protein [Paenibacillus curdlanolyticus]EFM10768.1 conserved hypothetical protein [Paenibacillus curdlanolyticus YK9]
MFSPEERQLMNHQFGLSFEPHSSPIATFKLTDLFEDAPMQQLIDVYNPLIKGLEPSVGAMYFTSSIIMFSAALHYMVAKHPQAIDFAPERFSAEVVFIDGQYSYYTVRFRVDEAVSVDIHQQEEHRIEQRNELLASLYAKTIRPMIESLHRVTGTPLVQMWGSFPRITYTYEHLIAQEQDEVSRKRLEDDYSYIKEEMPADAFGMKRNPYKHKYTLLDNPYNPDEPYKMKPTCCMFYRTEEGYYCYTCPRLKPKDREERRQKILADLALKQANG